MRINVYLAKRFGISRREGDKLIRAGKVTINGFLAEVGQDINDDETIDHKVTIDGHIRPTVSQKLVRISLYKPSGYVTTRSDQFSRRTVMDLLPVNLKTLKPVGRLDYESEGLLLLSNDGHFIHEFSHPKFEKAKEYIITLSKPITSDLVISFKQGVPFPEGLAKVDSLNQISQNQLSVVVHQGWNRQLRRMAAYNDYGILKLIRSRIGPYTLADLQPGEWNTISS
jgi:23S rRNA pseudouridine2604 synthase